MWLQSLHKTSGHATANHLPLAIVQCTGHIFPAVLDTNKLAVCCLVNVSSCYHDLVLL